MRLRRKRPQKHQLEVLLAIAAAFALGKALEASGSAKQVADGLLSLAGNNPWFTLAIIYFTTAP